MATKRSVTGRKATRAARRRTDSKNGIPRPIEMVKADLERATAAMNKAFDTGAKPAALRVAALEKELAEHPENAPKLDPASFTLAPQPKGRDKDAREVGDVLGEVIGRLECLQHVVTLAIGAAGDPNVDDQDTAIVLREHVESPLCEVVEELREVLEHARFRGSRLIVAKPEEGNAS